MDARCVFCFLAGDPLDFPNSETVIGDPARGADAEGVTTIFAAISLCGRFLSAVEPGGAGGGGGDNEPCREQSCAKRFISWSPEGVVLMVKIPLVIRLSLAK